jgi:hypothetical protein
MLNAHPDLGVFDTVFATEATVIVPGHAPVLMPVIPDGRLGQQTLDREGDTFILNSPHFDLRRDVIGDEVPVDTTITAARVEGQSPKAWRVIRTVDLDPEYITCLVV